MIQPSSMQAVPNKLNRSSRTLSKAFRSRHISINTSSINKVTGDGSSSPGSPGLFVSPLAMLHSCGTSSSAASKPTDVLVEVKADSEKNILIEEEDGFEQGEMRPRCRSESSANKKCGGFVPKEKTADS